MILTEEQTVLVIAAHPGDEVLGVWGIVRRHLNMGEFGVRTHHHRGDDYTV